MCTTHTYTFSHVYANVPSWNPLQVVNAALRFLQLWVGPGCGLMAIQGMFSTSLFIQIVTSVFGALTGVALFLKCINVFFFTFTIEPNIFKSVGCVHYGKQKSYSTIHRELPWTVWTTWILEWLKKKLNVALFFPLFPWYYNIGLHLFPCTCKPHAYFLKPQFNKKINAKCLSFSNYSKHLLELKEVLKKACSNPWLHLKQLQG